MVIKIELETEIKSLIIHKTPEKTGIICLSLLFCTRLEHTSFSHRINVWTIDTAIKSNEHSFCKGSLLSTLLSRMGCLHREWETKSLNVVVVVV